MSENMMVGSHKYTSKKYADRYATITKQCKCGRVVAMGEKCECEKWKQQSSSQ